MSNGRNSHQAVVGDVVFTTDRRDSIGFVRALVYRGISWEEASRAARRLAREEREHAYPRTMVAPLAGQRRALTVDVDPANGALVLMRLVDLSDG